MQGIVHNCNFFLKTAVLICTVNNKKKQKHTHLVILIWSEKHTHLFWSRNAVWKLTYNYNKSQGNQVLFKVRYASAFVYDCNIKIAEGLSHTWQEI